MQFTDSWRSYERVSREGLRTRAAVFIIGVAIVAYPIYAPAVLDGLYPTTHVEPVGPTITPGAILGTDGRQHYYPPGTNVEHIADRFEREAREPVKQLAPESEGAHPGYNPAALQHLIARYR